MSKVQCEQCGEKIGGFFGSPIVRYKRGDRFYSFCSEECLDDWKGEGGATAKAAQVVGAKGRDALATCWECGETMHAKFGSVVGCPHCDASNIIPKRDGTLPTKAEIGIKTLEDIGRAILGEDDD